MSRSISAAARQALFSSRTGQALIILLTIDHADLASPYHLACNSQDIESRGDTYQWMPFVAEFPGDSPDEPQQAVLTIYDPSRQITSAVRALATPPSVVMELVLASQPDTVDAGPFNFTLKNLGWDEMLLSGTLGYEDVFDEQYPGDSFTPAEYPGLF